MTAKAPEWTRDFEVLHGTFAVGKRGTTYLQSSVSLEDVQRFFVTVAEIPGNENWGFEALFQRDIDEERVSKELVSNYLLNHAKEFTFFPPLTIALLPFDGVHKRLEAKLGVAEKKADESWKYFSHGTIEYRLINTGELGYLKWDPTKVKAVAVDGQHRLAALKHASVRGKVGVDLNARQIPVTFLIPEPDRELVSQVREIFVDVNKSAKSVSGNRLILLDDRDPFKVFTRQLLREDFDLSFAAGIPYWLVDWKSDDPKPVNYQLTTMSVLFEVVQQVFEENPKKLDDLLELNAKLQAEKLAAVELEKSDEGTVLLSDDQMKVAVKAFNERVKPFIVKVYEKTPTFASFAAILSEAMKEDKAGKALKEYLLTAPKHRPKKHAELSTTMDVKAVLDAPLEKLESLRAESLLLTSVGQRALFRTYRNLSGLYPAGTPEQIADLYLKDISVLAANHFFDREFKVKNRKVWEGIALKSGNVAPTKGSVNKLGSFIFLAAKARKEGNADWIESKKSGAAPVINAYIDLFESEDEEDAKDEATVKKEATEYLREVLKEIAGYAVPP